MNPFGENVVKIINNLMQHTIHTMVAKTNDCMIFVENIYSFVVDTLQQNCADATLITCEETQVCWMCQLVFLGFS